MRARCVGCLHACLRDPLGGRVRGGEVDLSWGMLWSVDQFIRYPSVIPPTHESRFGIKPT